MTRKHPGRPGSRRHSFVKVAAVAAAFAASFVVAPGANADTGALLTTPLSGALTPTNLANRLVGSGVTVSNVVYTGANGAAGTFSGGGTGDGSIIGFDQGVVLSSGSISNVVGPNTHPGITTANGQPGDLDLNGLLPSGSTQDASVLSFDFLANASSISFRYVFASDEYNEFVNGGFNDVFGFFVNGHTLSTDCAKVDTQPVSIDTINGGSHPELFRNNSTDPGPATINTEMDGLTTVLLCQAPVVANETNTMKLAIADVNDQNLDSNVFIESGSLTTVPPVGTPTDVIGNPSSASAIVTWTPPEPNTNGPIDSFEVKCTATNHPDITASVAGTESAAQVNGLTNGIAYTCVVRAHSGDAAGDFSAPSDPFTPADTSVAQFVNPNAGGTVNLKPGQDSLGTSGQIIIAPSMGLAPQVTSSDPIIVTATLFGTPGEIPTDFSCGGNRCIGQGIQWAFSDPGAVNTIRVIFIESPALTHGADIKLANFYKNGVLIPNCRKHVKIQCIGERSRNEKSGVWKITFKTTGLDPRGRG